MRIHWFYAVLPAFILAGHAKDCSARWVCLLAAVMLNVNLFVFYGITGHTVIARTVGIDLSVILALLYGAIWLVLYYSVCSWISLRGEKVTRPATRKAPAPPAAATRSQPPG